MLYLSDDGTEVGHVGAVFKGGESFTTYDPVDLLLGLAHDIWVANHCQNKDQLHRRGLIEQSKGGARSEKT